MRKTIFTLLILFQTCLINGQVWNNVLSGSNGYIYALKNFQDTLFIAGGLDTLGGVYAPGIGNWEGNTFHYIGNMYGPNPKCYEIHNNELYVGGGFWTINGNPDTLISKYLGGNWLPIGSNIFASGSIYCLQSYQGNLYAGGSIYSNSNPNIRRIARWDGTQWSGLGTGMGLGGITQVYCMAVYNGELYIGGEFGSANGMSVNYIVKWNGTNFISIGTGADGYINAMLVDTVTNKLKPLQNPFVVKILATKTPKH
jgi:hypothetical protein